MIDPFFFTTTTLCNSIGVGRLSSLRNWSWFWWRNKLLSNTTSVYYVLYFGNILLNQYGHLQASNIKFIKSIAYNWTKYVELEILHLNHYMSIFFVIIIKMIKIWLKGIHMLLLMYFSVVEECTV